MPGNAIRSVHLARTLRNNATEAERRLWIMLGQYRPRFTRQLPIGPYVADFACRRAKIVVEIDGSQHVDNPRDAVRTAELQADGWRVVRFWNGDVLGNLEGVVEAIAEAVNSRLPPNDAFAAIASRTGRPRKARTRKEPPPTPPASAGGE